MAASKSLNSHIITESNLRIPVKHNPNPSFCAIEHGWFVPDARWLELREVLADKIESLEKK